MTFKDRLFYGMTTLHLACLSGSPNAVNAIFNYVTGKEYEEDFLSMKSTNKMNAFHYACMNWNSDVLLTLFQSGKYENPIDDNDENAVQEDYYKNDLNESAEDRLKPLHVAVMTGCLKNVDLILNYRQQTLQAEQQRLLQIKQIEQTQNAQKNIKSQVSQKPKMEQTLQNLNLFLKKTKFKNIHFNIPQQYKQQQQQQPKQEQDDINQEEDIQSEEHEDKEYLKKLSMFSKRGRELSNFSYYINAFTDKLRKTSLIMAVQYGDADIVSFLIKHKQIDLNFKDIIGRSALHYASLYGFSEIVKLLLHKKGLILNEMSSEGMTPLHYACFKDHPNVVSLLLRYQMTGISESSTICSSDDSNIRQVNKKFLVDVNMRTPWTLETPLHLVSSASVANVLLEDGFNIDLNAVDKNGLTPLHVACKAMNNDVAKALIKYASSNENHSSENSSSTTFAPSKVVDVNLQDKSGKTPLHYVCMNSDFELAKELLMVNGININLVDNDGLSPIRAACMNPDPNLINLILSRSDLIISDEDKEIAEKAREIKV